MDAAEKLTSDAAAMKITSRSKLPVYLKVKLWFFTLSYHSSFSFAYAVDTLMEPLFWFIDHFAKCLGQIFVGTVILLLSIVVIIAHLLGIPVWWYRCPMFTIVLFIIGYWILVNLSFNFMQAVQVLPGLPNNTQLLSGTTNVTVCKKCISPKPPRTHHCSICNRCCLCMCHHCPWVNNCIGHFNRRYFYLCMVYIVLGCLFVMLFGLEIAYHQVILEKNVLPFRKMKEDTLDQSAEGNAMYGLFQWLTFTVTYLIPREAVNENYYSSETKELDNEENETAELLFGILVTRSELLCMIYFVALLCIGKSFVFVLSINQTRFNQTPPIANCFLAGASLALGGLCIWHGKLISKGETSIEYHINKAERSKNPNFANPYDLGFRRNWEIFLGLDQPNVRFWRHIVFPSAHVPTGNGYSWEHLTKIATDQDCFKNT